MCSSRSRPLNEKPAWLVWPAEQRTGGLLHPFTIITIIGRGTTPPAPRQLPFTPSSRSNNNCLSGVIRFAAHEQFSDVFIHTDRRLASKRRTRDFFFFLFLFYIYISVIYTAASDYNIITLHRVACQSYFPRCPPSCTHYTPAVPTPRLRSETTRVLEFGKIQKKNGRIIIFLTVRVVS